jgi:hypothetical protein
MEIKEHSTNGRALVEIMEKANDLEGKIVLHL